MVHAHATVKAAKTVIEVADVAWSAVELLHHHNHQNPNHEISGGKGNCNLSSDEIDDLRKENRRLRELLEQNLKLIQDISPTYSRLDCPPDLHDRLVAAVDSKSFLSRLESLQSGLEKGNEFPFKKPTEVDLESAEILINVGREEPSWWVWVSDDMVLGTEEASGLDDENYVVVSEENVVDAVANFIARCVISNPKVQNMTPEQLQKTVMSSLGGLSKIDKMMNVWDAGMMFYCLSTWGLTIAGLYHSRSVLNFAAKGVHKTGSLLLKAF